MENSTDNVDSGRRCPICDLPLTSEDDTLAHLEDLHGLATADHVLERVQAEVARLKEALDKIHRLASACVGAGEAYGTEDTHLWREVEEWARS